VVRRRQKPARAPPLLGAPFRAKKNSAGILAQLDRLWQQCLPGFAQRRLATRAQTLSLSSLLCLGRHTVTGLLTTSGSQFHDWSAAYRLFSENRIPVDQLFSVVRRAVLEELPADTPVRAFLDDSLLRRSGSRTPGVAWRRDPLGPRFQTNFVRAQRFLQTSLALPVLEGVHRLVPVAFRHAPTPPKPRRQAPAAQWKEYRAQVRASRLSQRAAEQIRDLRTQLDTEASAARLLLFAFDGGYTNRTVLKQLPPRTVAIGRLRKDACLFYPPDPAAGNARGRKRSYGAAAPTPQQVLSDERYPWHELALSYQGTAHTLRYKRLSGLLWRAAGANQRLQLIVIAPLRYRPRQGSRLLYRDPAFLLCTDAQLDPRLLIETYFQRWDIEVNFRDEKTLLGVGQAQVRSPRSVESAPALAVASYALLLLATQRAFPASRPTLLPRPKWSAASASPRVSTQQAINQLRAEVWGRGLGLDNFSHFDTPPASLTKPQKSPSPLVSALCYAQA
jgi:hypothetical protein